jgi:hypothetical protein
MVKIANMAMKEAMSAAPLSMSNILVIALLGASSASVE